MQNVLVMGAGKIGSLIAFLLASSNDYNVYLADVNITDRPELDRISEKSLNLQLIQLDATNPNTIADFLKKHTMEIIVSSLPFYLNVAIATIAKEFNLHYFDLTEDVNTTQAVLKLAKNASSAFVPQCGLAPGFISIVANDLMKHYPKLDSVKMRVGALPINVSNSLQYSLTWSTEGLINEYGNPCRAIEDGKEITTFPLEDLEEIMIDGLTYEAFNTSGGIGSLAETYNQKVNHLNYKTIRYPGHCEKIRFLMQDLDLNHDREILKTILERALPKTEQDVVVVYVSATGVINNQLSEKNYVKKFYPKVISDITWSAIQLTTASGLCAVLDLIMQHPEKYKGEIRQEQFSLDELLNNRFGRYYAQV